jgi:parallel beta-helix repeat protein
MRMKGLLGKILVAGIVALFLGAVGVAFFRVNMFAYAAGTIYIRADGSVEGTTDIQSSDNVTYVFAAGINDSVVVERSNIIVDGNGHTLNGSSSLTYGFNLTSVSNVTIRNVNIVDFANAILLEGASQCVISNNTCTNNQFGIKLSASWGNTITGNNITYGDAGVYGNNHSNDNTISRNNISAASFEGIYLAASANNIIQSNSLFGNGFYGIYLGISCSNSVILGNNITNCSLDGIYIRNSSNCTVSGNDMANNRYGFSLNYASYGTISKNSITDSYGGFWLGSSSYLVISGNNITSNGYGFDLDRSDYNTFSENEVRNSTYYGVQLFLSVYNTFFHNNFVNNTQQVSIDGSLNTWWDKGYPPRGNYWSDYLTRYPNATEIDHTGIGNTAYEIDSNNTDYYPLMTPYETTSPTIIITSPENKSYAVNASIPLTFTVDEFVTWMGYSLDGQANVTITGNTTLPTLLDGWHHVTVYANDMFGNMGFATVYFTIDTTEPDITNVVQDPLTDILPDTVVKINATVTDATSGIEQVLLNCTFTNSTNTWYAVFSMTHLTGNIWNATIPPQPYGTNVTYVIVAEDNVGNTITTEQLGYEYEYHVVPEFTLSTVVIAVIIATSLIAIISRKKRTLPT